MRYRVLGRFYSGPDVKGVYPEGILKYPNFLQTTVLIIPMHIMRSVGGAMYLLGVIVMAYNLTKTMQQGKLVANEPAQAMAWSPYVPSSAKKHGTPGWNASLYN
jgi:cytochrome c oxidase cbb3-type subunit I/II